VRGTIVDREGKAQRAAVHVVREGRPLVQRVTGDDGVFDLIGLKAGSYQVDAESPGASTPHPVSVDLEENEAEDIRLIVEPDRVVTGSVLTPVGAPASGATIQFSTDDGSSWRKVISDARGRFEIQLPPGAGDVQLAVLTFAYPALLRRVPASMREPVAIVLRAHGGIVRIKEPNGFPYVRSVDGVMPFRSFYFPEPHGHFAGGIYLAAGTYMICPDRTLGTRCQTVSVPPGGEAQVDFGALDASGKE
jgi:hypothetical protein